MIPQPNILSFVLVSLILILSGCSTTQTVSPVKAHSSPEKRKVQLTQLQKWQVQGKIAFIKEKSRDSATIFLQVNEKDKTQQLNLTTYLGINVLKVESTDTSHAIIFGGERYQGNDLEALIFSLTGLTIPTKALAPWLKALTYHNNDEIIYDEKTQLPRSLLSHYNNEIWQVSYAGYQFVSGYNLPTKISITKDKLRIKIAINTWTLL